LTVPVDPIWVEVVRSISLIVPAFTVPPAVSATVAVKVTVAPVSAAEAGEAVSVVVVGPVGFPANAGAVKAAMASVNGNRAFCKSPLKRANDCGVIKRPFPTARKKLSA
jgi:hypothetical protein